MLSETRSRFFYQRLWANFGFLWSRGQIIKSTTTPPMPFTSLFSRTHSTFVSYLPLPHTLTPSATPFPPHLFNSTATRYCTYYTHTSHAFQASPFPSDTVARSSVHCLVTLSTFVQVMSSRSTQEYSLYLYINVLKMSTFNTLDDEITFALEY
ncbi:hypothetical protein E2C01_096768 [Portunus trituberculatus]|uniref:Uncharacterized protein n=1 Tax=Portunus trituberculatus TaxID=210409 RepID=A0A5B7K850_PORTR|nr:hypothetical protein [Portunus trituberculatus]